MSRLLPPKHAYVLCFVGPLVLPSLALGAEVDVCPTCDVTTIAAAVAITVAGDTIWVHPGTYHESLTLTSERHIRSTGGSAVTQWVGTGTNVVAVMGGNDIRIDGFTLVPWDGSTGEPPTAQPTHAPSRAIEVNNASVLLQDVRVSTHRSTLSGGAVMMSDAVLSVEGSAFTDIEAVTGGAFYTDRSTLVLVDSDLSDNVAAIGGAIKCQNSVIDARYTQFVGNRAQDPASDALGFGGAIHGQRCNIRSFADQFVGNTAGLGGHLRIDGGSLVSDQTRFESGDGDVGGAVWFKGTSIVLNSSYFLDNSAINAAGAVYIEHQADAVQAIHDSTFRGNTTSGVGGAVRVVSPFAGATLSVTESHFLANEAVNGGGAVSTRGVEHLAVVSSSFLDNVSSSEASGGGALRSEFAAGLGTSLSVSNSYFCKNTAGAGGALAAITDNRPVTLLDSVWVQNSATSAGALLLDAADLQAENNTFLDNSTTGLGPVGVLRSGDVSFTYNVVDPTPVGAGALQTSGTFGLVFSNHNLWWSDIERSFGGVLQPRVVNGADSVQDQPLWQDYDPTQDCLDWSFTPAPDSPVIGINRPDIGASGGELGPTAFSDMDSDGVAQPMDCDDTDPTRYPGAPEACDGLDNDCNGLIDDIDINNPDVSAFTYYYDADGDGFGGTISAQSCRQPTRWVTNTDDCDDTDRNISPAAAEVWYDGTDQDCDNGDDFDQDGDGSPIALSGLGSGDCNDQDPTIRPLAAEIWYDNIDQNCDGANDFDQDQDGSAINDPVPDCDDEDSARSPLFTEQWYDGIDQACDLGDDFDQDGDGQQIASAGGLDCDDEDNTIFAGAQEFWYDGIDQDCDGANDYDQDGDGFTFSLPTPDGTPSDCDDLNADIFPGRPEIANDGIDQDCNDFDFIDVDEDGFAARDTGGDDCNDFDVAINPTAQDIPYDGIDQDCAGGDLVDVDGDGFDAMVVGGQDCDDADSAISPSAQEIWYDGVDQDCDGANDYDQDRDEWTVQAGDCDDEDPERHPGADEQTNGGVDLNCDGYAPVSRVTGSGCASVPYAPHSWTVLVGLLALGLRRRR